MKARRIGARLQRQLAAARRAAERRAWLGLARRERERHQALLELLAEGQALARSGGRLELLAWSAEVEQLLGARRLSALRRRRRRPHES